MQFGVFLPQGWRTELAGVAVEQHWPVIVDAAVTAEAAGYDSVWVFDHFHTVPLPTQEATYEAWTLMAALAASTERIRLGQMCTCNGYRSPAYLAKVAASVDVISGGRLEMGIGAGWYEHEYQGYGYPFPPGPVRLRELDEAIQIMKAMWTEDEVHFAGEHYTLDGAICQPKPLQQPHIPIWVAGGGEKVTLRLAARYGWASNFGWKLEDFVTKSAILAGHCETEGTDFDAIVRSADFNVVCEATEADVVARLDWIEEHHRAVVGDEKAAQARKGYAAMAGTPEQLVERFGAWNDAGLDYAIMGFFEAGRDQTGIERFAAEVMPALR